jgi:putative hydrolase of the HAD superfamily
MYQTFIFDFFGVVCSEIAPFWLGRHFSNQRAIEIKKTLVHSADLGKISEAEMFSQLGEWAGISADQVRSEWNDEVRVKADVVEFLKQLKSTYPLGLLTNSPSPFVRGILDSYNLNELFNSIVVSSEIGIAKPDVRTYTRILKDLDTVAAQALFVDDNPLNVEGAAKIGLKGIVYKSLRELRDTITTAQVI